MSTLELRGIRKNFGQQETLKGIDLSLKDGEFLVLLGASGCGKSTLLSLISGLAEPTAGEIWLDGRRLNGVAPKDRDIAMVFQSYALYPNLTVGRNIGFGLEMRGTNAREREAAVAEAAKMLRIDHLLERKPADLSGGQRQRVAIGRAMVRKPSLFLFDEPLSNLDARLRMEMRSEIKRLHQMLGVTMVYVTHDQIEAMTLATRIAVMRDGQVEQLGTPEEIYRQPATEFVAGFVGAPPMNMLEAQIRGGRVELPDLGALPLAAPLAEGAALRLGIRPEALLLAAAGAIRLEGMVELVEFTGPERVVSLRLAGGQMLVAVLPAGQNPTPGERLALHCTPGDVVLFDAAGRRVA